ncbi:YfhJ family protein [Salirhabdus salicampi]|uniref:YfhJ family protein n=1 Tax=Salirhabdus salicampi TaxID=476102 RepID=UPI0020C32B18|nr:YfhJ family protein [Salirhabdus salicampi]MCP8617964.1 YfhJ family protein [Salirhabdus salicampi]
MEEIYERLTKQLMNINNELSKDVARTWVELLWEDFEVTRAKAGHKYKGQEMTERIVTNWIINYGSKLHEMSVDKFKNRK